MYRRASESSFRDLSELVFVVCDTAARAPQRKRGTDDYGVTYLLCYPYAVFEVVHDF